MDNFDTDWLYQSRVSTLENLPSCMSDRDNCLFQVTYKVGVKMNEKIGRCHDCTAPQTEVNMLSRHILELQNDKGELIDKVRDLEEKLANADYQLEGRDLEIKELKAQIEKMKCCYNCKHSRTEYEHCRTEKSEKWELKEK